MLSSNPDIVFTKNFAIHFGISQLEVKKLFDYLSTLPVLSIVDFSKIMCTLNFAINKTEISPSDLLINQDKDTKENLLTNSDITSQMPKRNYQFEQIMLQRIKDGNSIGLMQLLSNANMKVALNFSDSNIRSLKDTVIIAITLASRAAITGGVDIEQALTQSDKDIRLLESVSTSKDAFDIMAKSVINFASLAAKYKISNDVSPVVKEAVKYILNNLTSSIKLEEIADYVKVNKNYLSSLFKKEMNMSISDYISSKKIADSKIMLTSTNIPIIEIAYYFSFCSQSHYQNTFKKYEGCTPLEYRKLRPSVQK